MEKENILIYYNQGNFQLSTPLFIPVEDYGEVWRKSACADLDGNGYNDIVTIRYIHSVLPDNVNILFNDGNGNFVEEPLSTTNNQQSTTNNQLTCYPNPFQTEITFEYTIKETALAELSVYDFQGRIITCLTKNAKKGGNYKIKWDGLDNGGKPCKPGPYLLTLKVNGNVLQTIKLIKYYGYLHLLIIHKKIS